MSTPTTHEAPSHGAADGHDGPPHPSDGKYIKIALILAAITAVEVVFSYWEAVEGFLAPALIGMSVVKFVIVVAYFMHLRFDSPLLRRLFVAGICLAIFCFGIVLTTFHVWTR